MNIPDDFPERDEEIFTEASLLGPLQGAALIRETMPFGSQVSAAIANKLTLNAHTRIDTLPPILYECLVQADGVYLSEWSSSRGWRYVWTTASSPFPSGSSSKQTQRKHVSPRL